MSSATSAAPRSSSCSRRRWRIRRQVVLGGCRPSGRVLAGMARCCWWNDEKIRNPNAETRNKPQVPNMDRCVEPEWLDHLAVDDPGAAGSRRDLRRLNTWMGHAGFVSRALRSAAGGSLPKRVGELGGGDGIFLLRVAQRLVRLLPSVHATIVDRQALVSPATRAAFAAVGWRLETVQEDVFDWLEHQPQRPDGGWICNLFLPHFNREQLARLLGEAALRAQVFVALEPRRSSWSLTFSRLVGLIGCNSVTQHDAPASVRAGFAGHELSQLWPANEDWRLKEGAVGLFS